MSINRFTPVIACFVIVLSSMLLQAQASNADAASKIDPRAILLRADSALRSLERATYSGRYIYISSSRGDTSTYRGSVCLIRDREDTSMGALVRLDLDNGITYTYRREALQIVNPLRKEFVTVGAGEEPARFILGNMFGSLVEEYPFGDDTGFVRRMKNAVKMETLDMATIEGVRCHVIKLYGESDDFISDRTTWWYIGADDYLPRRVLLTYQFGGGLQQQDLIVGDMRINPPLPDALFTQSAPEGFETKQYKRPAAAERPKLLEAGTTAPDWTLNDLEKREVKLSGLRGKVVLADFWYSTCGPCVAALPGIQKIHERFAKRGVEVVGINAHESGDPAAFMKRLGYTYRVLVNGDSVANDYHVTGFPTIYVIGVDGAIIHVEPGYAKGFEDELGEIIDRYLKEHGM